MQRGFTTKARLQAAEHALSEARSKLANAQADALKARAALATGQATGTGTDCLALACMPGQGRYAGLHTAVGEAIGACVRQAVEGAAADWVAWRDAERARRAGG